MDNLQKWIDIIKQKRKNTSFPTYIKSLASLFPVVISKNAGHISRYPDSQRIGGVLPSLEFEQERESYTKYGQEYNFEKNFFENFQTLREKIKFPTFTNYGGVENSDYADTVHGTKNAYLTFNSVWGNENIFYSCCIKDNCRNIYNSFMSWDHSENVYMSVGIIRGYQIFYSKFIVNSDNIWLSSNLMSCSECILCEGLTNKKYCISNKEYSKEEYFIKKKEILAQKDTFLEVYKNIKSLGNNFGSEDVSQSSFSINSQKVENANLVYEIHRGRNLFVTGGAKGSEDVYDMFVGGSNGSSNLYGGCNVGTAENIYIGESVGMSSYIFYSTNIQDCSFCLGCIGLKNKSYCILNKQYTKEEWYELVDKIFSQMEHDGILGDFFPGWLNPFYFNDTMAGILGDFTKQEVEQEGYMWRDEKIKVDIPEGAEVVKTTPPAHTSFPPQLREAQGELLSDYQGYDEKGNWYISLEILKKVIVDEKGNYYRIVQMEYDFLMKYSLPLPEIHWLERMKYNFGVIK